MEQGIIDKQLIFSELKTLEKKIKVMLELNELTREFDIYLVALIWAEESPVPLNYKTLSETSINKIAHLSSQGSIVRARAKTQNDMELFIPHRLSVIKNRNKSNGQREQRWIERQRAHGWLIDDTAVKCPSPNSESSIYESVKDIMKREIDTRNSDTLLIFRVWARDLLKKFLFKDLKEFTLKECLSLTNPASISRARRLIQNDQNELLPTVEKVRKKRKIREEAYREYYMNREGGKG